MATNNPPPPPDGEAYRGYTPQTPRPGSDQNGMFQSSYPPSGEETAPVYNPQPSSYSQQPYEPYPPYQQPSYDQQQPYQQPPYDQQYQQSSSYGQRQQQYWQPFSGQPIGAVGPDERTSMGMKVRLAALLSCLFGWVGGIIFLLLERENRYVRFYAMQSLLFFGGMSILQAIIAAVPFLFGPSSAILGIITFIVWVVLLYMTFQGRYYKLPVIGDYAERLLNGGMFR